MMRSMTSPRSRPDGPRADTNLTPLPRSEAALVLREAASDYLRLAAESTDPARYLIMASDYHARALKLESGIPGEAPRSVSFNGEHA